jgi:glycerophosphoryl diester phosphodiesterase
LARRDAQLFDVLVEARNGSALNEADMTYLASLGAAVEELPTVARDQSWRTVALGVDARPGVLNEVIRSAFARVEQTVRADGSRPLRYQYRASNERDILFDGLWYKFSFVPERRGAFDKPLLLEDVIENEHDGFVVPHVAPAHRACPFCGPMHDEVLCSVRLSSEELYTFVVNLDPYADDHVLMAADDERAQILTESRILDLLEVSCALGQEYEGSFTSFSGASVKHWHGQFYRTKTPVWRNFFEGRLQLVGTTASDGVIEGELAGWPARSVMFMGDNARSLACEVWRCVSDLMTHEIPYNSKFLYKDGKYYFLLAPRLHGFMAFAKYLLGGDTANGQHVSGCGSIESPGGDAVMFFDLPEDLPPSRRTEMARRFAKTLEETSNWVWQRPRLRKTASRRPSHKQTAWSTKPRSRIAHRVDSLEAARAAIDLGFEFLEIDVQTTRDGVLIVQWGNLRTGEQTEILAFERDFADLNAIANGQLLRVDEFCDFVGDRARLAFDIKDWSDALPGYRTTLLDALVTLAQDKGLLGSSIFESFNLDYIKALVERADAIGADITVGLAIARGTLLDEEQTTAEIAQAATVGARTLFVYPSDLTLPVAKQVRAAGLSLLSSAEGLSDDVRELVSLAVVDRLDWARSSLPPLPAQALTVLPRAVPALRASRSW